MVRRSLPAAVLVLAALAAAGSAGQAPGARARDRGITFGASTGAHNAITDVAGVTEGQVTLVRGEGPLVVGQGPVRTGVTAVQPRGGRDELTVPLDT